MPEAASPQHCIRVVSAHEATGPGWLALNQWMADWAGRSELHLVHIERLDLLGLQQLLARIEHALALKATQIVVDIGSSQITPAALLSLIAERRHLMAMGVDLKLRGRADLSEDPSGDRDDAEPALPARHPPAQLAQTAPRTRTTGHDGMGRARQRNRRQLTLASS